MRTLDSNEIDAVSGGDVVEGALIVAGGIAVAVVAAPFCGIGLAIGAAWGAGGGALLGYSAGSAWHAWNAG